MNLGFEFVAATPKRERDNPETTPAQSRMAPTGTRRNPSTDQKKVRRQISRQGALSTTDAPGWYLIDDQGNKVSGPFSSGADAKWDQTGGESITHWDGTQKTDKGKSGTDSGRYTTDAEGHPITRSDYAASKHIPTKEPQMVTEAELLAKMAAATSLPAQRALAAELETLRMGKSAAIRHEASLDLATKVVQSRFPTLAPAQFSQHTAATDWLGEVEPDIYDTRSVEANMRAEATVWFQGRPDFVKADTAELHAQAAGMASRLASQYGVAAVGARYAFMGTVAHLAGIKMADTDPTLPTTPYKQTPSGSSLPLGVDNKGTFDQDTWTDSVSTPDPKSTENTSAAPSLSEGDAPESDSAASMENPDAAATHDNDGKSTDFVDYIDGTTTPNTNSNDEKFSAKNSAASPMHGAKPGTKCRTCGEAIKKDAGGNYVHAEFYSGQGKGYHRSGHDALPNKGNTSLSRRHQATLYCPKHKVFVGPGNADTHAGCKKETRKAKESSRHTAVGYAVWSTDNDDWYSIPDILPGGEGWDKETAQQALEMDAEENPNHASDLEVREYDFDGGTTGSAHTADGGSFAADDTSNVPSLNDGSAPEGDGSEAPTDEQSSETFDGDGGNAAAVDFLDGTTTEFPTASLRSVARTLSVAKVGPFATALRAMASIEDSFGGVSGREIVSYVLRHASLTPVQRASLMVLAGEVPEAFKKQWDKDGDDDSEGESDTSDQEHSDSDDSDDDDSEGENDSDKTPDFIQKKIDDSKKGSRRTAAGATRPLYEIADEISRVWRPVYFGAVPYLDAMGSLSAITDSYGMDGAKSIVAYFLSNASTWRGEDARRIKKELKGIMDSGGSWGGGSQASRRTATDGIDITDDTYDDDAYDYLEQDEDPDADPDADDNGEDDDIREHKESRLRFRTAAEGMKCSVCGAAIEKDPAGEANAGWHHNDGSTHDHEAKPGGGSKESGLRINSTFAARVRANLR